MEIGLVNERGAGIVELDADELPDTVEVASGVTLVVRGNDAALRIAMLEAEELETKIAWLEASGDDASAADLAAMKAECAAIKANISAMQAKDTAALAAKIIPKPHEDGQSTSFFKVKTEESVDGGISLAVVLDKDAVKPDDTAAEVVASANMAAIDSAAEGANVSVKLSNAKPGLYYGVAVAGDIAGLEKAAENVSLSRAGADGVEVPVVKPAGGAAFFKVVVSDRAQ